MSRELQEERDRLAAMVTDLDIDLENARSAAQAGIDLQRKLDGIAHSALTARVAELDTALADANHWRERWCNDYHASAARSNEHWKRLMVLEDTLARVRELIEKWRLDSRDPPTSISYGSYDAYSQGMANADLCCADELEAALNATAREGGSRS